MCMCQRTGAHLGNKDTIQTAMCYDSVIRNSSVKVHIFKWPVREAGIGIGIASIKP